MEFNTNKINIKNDLPKVKDLLNIASLKFVRYKQLERRPDIYIEYGRIRKHNIYKKKYTTTELKRLIRELVFPKINKDNNSRNSKFEEIRKTLNTLTPETIRYALESEPDKIANNIFNEIVKTIPNTFVQKMESNINNIESFIKDISGYVPSNDRSTFAKLEQILQDIKRTGIKDPIVANSLLNNAISMVSNHIDSNSDISIIDTLKARKKLLMSDLLEAKYELDKYLIKKYTSHLVYYNYDNGTIVDKINKGLPKIYNELFEIDRDKGNIRKLNESNIIKKLKNEAVYLSSNKIKEEYGGSLGDIKITKVEYNMRKNIEDYYNKTKIYNDINKNNAIYKMIDAQVKLKKKGGKSNITPTDILVNMSMRNKFKSAYKELNRENRITIRDLVNITTQTLISDDQFTPAELSAFQIKTRVSPNFKPHDSLIKSVKPKDNKKLSGLGSNLVRLDKVVNSKKEAGTFIDKLIHEHQLKIRRALGIDQFGADIGQRYYVLGQTMAKAIPTMPITQTNTVIKNIVNKITSEFNLDLSAISIGYDGSDIVLEIDASKLLKGINVAVPELKSKLPPLTLRIPNFRGNLYVRHNRLYAGVSGIELIRSHNTARIISFGERIQNSLLDAELLKGFKDRLRFISATTPQYESLYMDKIRQELHKITYIMNNKVEKILERSKDVHNDSLQETILKAAKISDIHLERLFSSDYSKYLDKEIINMSSKLSSGSIYEYVKVMRNMGYNVTEEDIKGYILNRIRQLKQKKAKTIHGARTINIVDDYIKSMTDVNKMIVSKNGIKKVYTPNNVKFLPDAFSVSITKLMKGELSLFDVAELKYNLAFPYAKGSKPMFRPYQNAFGLSYGKYIETQFAGSYNKTINDGPSFTVYDKTMHRLISNQPLNDAEVFGNILINIDDSMVTSTEGNLLLTESLGRKVLPVEVNAGFKLTERQFKQLLKAMAVDSVNDKELGALVNRLNTALKKRKDSPVTGKEVILNIFKSNEFKRDTISLRKELPLKKVGLSLKLGNYLKRMKAIRKQDERANYIIIKQFVYNPDGTVTIVYDAAHNLGMHSKIFTMHTKGIHNGIRLINANSVKNIVKSYTGKVMDAEMAESIDVIISSKAWEKQHYAPIAQGLMIETADQIIKGLAKEFDLSKDAITSIADEVIYSYLELIDPNLKDKTSFFGDLVVMNKYQKPLKIGKDQAIDLSGTQPGSAKELRAIWHESAFARLNKILNVNKRADVLMNSLRRIEARDLIRKKMIDRIKKLMGETQLSESAIAKIINTALDRILYYDKNGALRNLVVKNFITVTKENPFELYKVSKFNGKPYDILSDGIKFGINEYMVFKAIGLDEQARTILSMKSLGQNYVSNYYVTLLRMLGFSDKSLINLYPNYFNRTKDGEYIPDKPKILTYEDIRKIKKKLEEQRKEEHLGMFDWVKPNLTPADYIDPKTGLMSTIKIDIEPKNKQMILEQLRQQIEEKVNMSDELISEDWKHIIERANYDKLQSVLLSDKEYKSLKEFLRHYHAVKIDNVVLGGDSFVGKIKLSGIDRSISEVPLARKIITNKDAIKIKLPILTEKGIKYENRWVLNATLTNMVKLLRELMNGDSTIEDISRIVNEYYYELANKALRAIGEPIKSPAIMQIGIPKLILNSKKDVDEVLNAMGKQTRIGTQFIKQQESALADYVNGIWQIYPNAGEVIISKKSFIKMLQSRGDMPNKEILKLASDVINGQKNFMGNLVRFPTKDHKSILPVSFRLIDTDRIKDKKLRASLEEAMIINAIDGATLSGDWDKDIYFVTTLIAENKDKNTIETLTRYFSDLSYKINEEGTDFDTKYIPTGRRTRVLFDSYKEVHGMLGTNIKNIKGAKEDLVSALHEGVRLTPDTINDAIKKLHPDEKLSEEKINELTNHIIGNLKEIHGEDRLDNYYILNFGKKTSSIIDKTLRNKTPEMAIVNKTFGLDNKTFLLDVLQKTYEASGIKGKELDEAIHAIKIAKSMNITSFITVKALTGEIYNFAHNKVWNAVTATANELYGVDSQKAKSIIRYMQEYVGEATQANISSKHLFPTIAPDVIKTFKEYALGSEEQRKKAWEKITKGDFEGILSNELIDTIKDVSKYKHKFVADDANFINRIMRKIENNKQTISGKDVYIRKPVSMRLSELAKLGTIAEKYADKINIDQIRLDALKDIAKVATKEQLKLTPLEEQRNILSNRLFIKELGQRMNRKHVVDNALVKTYKLMTDSTNIADSMIEIMSITQEKAKKDWAAQFLLSATRRKNHILAKEIPEQFHNTVNFDNITKSIESSFKKVFKRAYKSTNGKLESGIEDFAGHVKKSGIGLLFGSALVGYFTYQALKPYDDSWLGLDKGKEYYKKTGKSDRHMAELDMISSLNLPTDMDVLGLPHGLNKHTARIMINRLRNKRMSYDENLKGQYNAYSTLNRRPTQYNTKHGVLFERAMVLTNNIY